MLAVSTESRTRFCRQSAQEGRRDAMRMRCSTVRERCRRKGRDLLVVGTAESTLMVAAVVGGGGGVVVGSGGRAVVALERL